MNFERNRLNSMILLRDRLAELFALIGTDQQKVPVTPLHKVLELLELIIRDNALYDYLESLDAQTVQAIQKMKERNLDDWNSRENEKLLEKMLDEEQAFQLRLDEAAKEREENLVTIKALTGEKEALQRSCSLLTEELDHARKTETELRGEQLGMIKAVISMRDSLLMRAGWIAEHTPEETAAAKLVDTQLQETARLLQGMDVGILEDTGRYDSRTHTVAGTIPAVSADQIHRIAETVRPGYRFRGECLRSQEVIIYVKPGGDA